MRSPVPITRGKGRKPRRKYSLRIGKYLLQTHAVERGKKHWIGDSGLRKEDLHKRGEDGFTEDNAKKFDTKLGLDGEKAISVI